MNQAHHMQMSPKMPVILLWLLCVLILLVALVLSGCNRGDFKVSPVVEGQASPHAGFNLGPDTWVETGNEIKVTGAVIWIKGVDPNSMLGDPE